MKAMTLEPCPFCGGSTVDRLKVTGRCIECLGCGASGPELPREADREALIRAWNRRAQPAQAVDVGAINGVIVDLEERARNGGDAFPDEFEGWADQLTRALSGEKAGPVGDGAVERLAQFIVAKESHNCKTLDEALFHRSTWRRVIPEAREMLEAALLPASPTPDKEGA